MNHSLLRFAVAVGTFSSLFSGTAVSGQDCATPQTQPLRNQEPPGRDLFIPYVATPGATVEQEVRNVHQLRVLAEINKLTIELVKRRSNRYVAQADTPQLIKRLKQLAKELQDGN